MSVKMELVAAIRKILYDICENMTLTAIKEIMV